MNAVILAEKPNGISLILSRRQTMIPRKTKPKIQPPFKVYLYQTKAPVSVMFSGSGPYISEYDKTYCYNERSGRIIGEFICDYIVDLSEGPQAYEALCEESGMSLVDIYKYFRATGNIGGYGWHITQLKVYEKPIELSWLSKYGFIGLGYSNCVCGNSECKYFEESYNYDEPPTCSYSTGCCGCQCYVAPQDWYYVHPLRS